MSDMTYCQIFFQVFSALINFLVKAEKPQPIWIAANSFLWCRRPDLKRQGITNIKGLQGGWYTIGKHQL
jgi:hypothetical protein